MGRKATIGHRLLLGLLVVVGGGFASLLAYTELLPAIARGGVERLLAGGPFEGARYTVDGVGPDHVFLSPFESADGRLRIGTVRIGFDPVDLLDGDLSASDVRDVSIHHTQLALEADDDGILLPPWSEQLLASLVSNSEVPLPFTSFHTGNVSVSVTANGRRTGFMWWAEVERGDALGRSGDAHGAQSPALTGTMAAAIPSPCGEIWARLEPRQVPPYYQPGDGAQLETYFRITGPDCYGMMAAYLDCIGFLEVRASDDGELFIHLRSRLEAAEVEIAGLALGNGSGHCNIGAATFTRDDGARLLVLDEVRLDAIGEAHSLEFPEFIELSYGRDAFNVSRLTLLPHAIRIQGKTQLQPEAPLAELLGFGELHPGTLEFRVEGGVRKKLALGRFLALTPAQWPILDSYFELCEAIPDAPGGGVGTKNCSELPLPAILEDLAGP